MNLQANPLSEDPPPPHRVSDLVGEVGGCSCDQSLGFSDASKLYELLLGVYSVGFAASGSVKVCRAGGLLTRACGATFQSP